MMIKEFCPVPSTMGMGPISITAPPLTPFIFRFESDPSVINTTPKKMMANAAKNNHVAREKVGVIEDSIRAAVGLSLFWHSEHDQWVESKQLLQTALPQS